MSKLSTETDFEKWIDFGSGCTENSWDQLVTTSSITPHQVFMIIEFLGVFSELEK